MTDMTLLVVKYFSESWTRWQQQEHELQGVDRWKRVREARVVQMTLGRDWYDCGGMSWNLAMSLPPTNGVSLT